MLGHSTFIAFLALPKTLTLTPEISTLVISSPQALLHISPFSLSRLSLSLGEESLIRLSTAGPRQINVV